MENGEGTANMYILSEKDRVWADGEGGNEQSDKYKERNLEREREREGWIEREGEI